MLDELDAQLSRLGPYSSTAAVTAMAAAAALPLHAVLRTVEGLPVQPLALFNLSVVVTAVAAPIIFYARDVIAQLKESRAQMDEMSRHLAISVEQAEQANKAKSAFLANMSHELRTPLNAIMGFSEVMKEEHLGPVQNARYLSYAGDIHSSGRYLLGIINDILDLSKIEAGKMSLENAEEFSLRQSLEGSLHMVATLGEKYGVRVSGEMPAAHIRLLAVERMVRQILINLLSNAIKFTPAGGSVTVSAAAGDDGSCTVIVQDTGIGMTEREVEQALTPFGQVQNKLTARHNGTGLGLPLAKAMLELHGGTLAISSLPGHGTRIVLNFPASRVCRGRRVVAA